MANISTSNPALDMLADLFPSSDRETQQTIMILVLCCCLAAMTGILGYGFGRTVSSEQARHIERAAERARWEDECVKRGAARWKLIPGRQPRSEFEWVTNSVTTFDDLTALMMRIGDGIVVSTNGISNNTQ